MDEPEQIIEVSIREADARRAAFLAAVPKSLLTREDALTSDVARENASARSKLRRVYSVMDEISAYRADHVACRRACSACCRMNITITSLEAGFIAASTGRAAAQIITTIAHAQDKFVGRPCPFLVAEECSIYDSRPLACRKHASYFTTEKWCSPPYLNSVKAPLVRFGGLDEALTVLSTRRGSPVFADIRDFFGRTEEAKCG